LSLLIYLRSKPVRLSGRNIRDAPGKHHYQFSESNPEDALTRGKAAYAGMRLETG
jgi:hypothetical protein